MNFPQISPELVSFTIAGFEIAIRWYALAYIVGILIGWRLGRARFCAALRSGRKTRPRCPQEQLEALLTWIISRASSLADRLGYVFFYEPATYLAEPCAG